jgi:hypothetical protein
MLGLAVKGVLPTLLSTCLQCATAQSSCYMYSCFRSHHQACRLELLAQLHGAAQLAPDSHKQLTQPRQPCLILIVTKSPRPQPQWPSTCLSAHQAPGSAQSFAVSLPGAAKNNC